MSEKFTFCAVPYVGTDDVVAIGDFIFWPNTPENWDKYTQLKWSAHMEQYHNRQDQPVGKNGSVITHKDLNKLIPREEFRDVVICLSTAAWLLGTPSADCWLLETWELAKNYDPEEGVYRRPAKFQELWNSPDYDTLRPNPYLRSIKFSPVGGPGSISHTVLQYVVGEFLKARKDSAITAMHRFHRIRQETPYYNSVGDDLEGLWSGFESLFQAPISTRPQERWEWIFDRIKEELKPESAYLKAEFWGGIELWAEETYKQRNAHTHGLPDLVTDVKLTANGHSLYYIGLFLAQTILKLRTYVRLADCESELQGILDEFNAAFGDYPNADKVITFLKKTSNKELIGQKIAPEMCEAIQLLANNNRKIGSYENLGKLLDALQTLNLTFSEFAKKLPTMGLDTDNGYSQAWLQFPSLLEQAVEQVKQARNGVARKGYTSEEKVVIKRAVLNFIDKSNLHNPFYYKDNNPQTLEKLKIGEGASLWILASLYKKLFEMLPRWIVVQKKPSAAGDQSHS